MSRYSSLRFLSGVLTVLSGILFIGGGILGMALGGYVSGNVALLGATLAGWPRLVLIGLGLLAGLLAGLVLALPYLIASEVLNVLPDIAEHTYQTRREIERMRRRMQ